MQFLVEFFVCTSEEDEIWKNGSCEHKNTGSYLLTEVLAKNKKEKRNKAAEKQAKEGAIQKKVDISRQGEAEERHEECML